ncbi:hypothetical protein BVC93_21625 [Mycobacterium sp. MS1601]|uniref:hypothetical protein n=1 Tax=Mycobacterium sp. MS1601 TaxID=1936029 RepID=UPI0009796E0F|nr:hypothetical protein [Mycobacterium sp. MS1601]AQA04592.1 hypothetical protein BVC93_21625 [Mycobacterium sp. MS1601]
MKKFTVATIVGTALTAATLGLAAPALAAPTGVGNAQDTISSLEAQGYKVIVNRLGNAPLNEANVVSVGEGPSFNHPASGLRLRDNYTGHDRNFGTQQVQSVYVTIR